MTLLCGGCAATPEVQRRASLPPIVQPNGSSYVVQPGESLWGIAHDFGVGVEQLAAFNRLSDPSVVKPGQRLFIPAPLSSHRFLWPARGRVTSTKHAAVRAVKSGLEIWAPEGSIVRASRTGRVAVATRALAGWGKTVILDHGDGYVTVYTGMEQLLVHAGVEVRQGNPVGRLGQTPLHFEIRHHSRADDPLRFLP